MALPAPPTPLPDPGVAGASNVQFMLCSADWTITHPVTKVYGLDHLSGQIVTGLLDGIRMDDTTVGDDGTVDLPFPASFITIGLGFAVQIQTPYLDIGNPTIQGRRKDITAVTVRVDASAIPDIGSNQIDGGAQIPPQVDVVWDATYPAVTQNPDLTPETYTGPSGQLTTKLFSGDFRANIQAGWDERGQTAVQMTDPRPLAVTAVMPEVLEGDVPEQTYSEGKYGRAQQQPANPRPPGMWMLRA